MEKSEKFCGKEAHGLLEHHEDVALVCDDGTRVIVPKYAKVHVSYRFDFFSYSPNRSYPDDELLIQVKLQYQNKHMFAEALLDYDTLIDAFTSSTGAASYTTVYELCPPAWRQAFRHGILLNGYHHVNDSRDRGRIAIHYGLSTERQETLHVRFKHHSLIVSISALRGDIAHLYLKAHNYVVERHGYLSDDEINRIAHRGEDYEMHIDDLYTVHGFNLIAPMPNMKGFFQLGTLQNQVFRRV